MDELIRLASGDRDGTALHRPYDSKAISDENRGDDVLNGQLRPDRQAAMQAVETLLAFMGENPQRSGLLETPRRVVDALLEHGRGYDLDPDAILARTFDEVEGYDDMVLLQGIRFESRCEHHLEPIIGVAHVAYLPSDRVVGLSKIARVVDVFAKRLQVQERMTAQIASAIDRALAPRGVAVWLSAEHFCMASRGVHKVGVSTHTQRMTGLFAKDVHLATRFMTLAKAD
ncbi:GTP cyclohydrolase 1 [Iodidimonas nitroreducens]|uniref:GTP cyclohydrolase 1 n=1 Tax=Iodidimonas nitroreducens TaxID=1236968 RepID=A0A5A7N3T1_9PROT|nr:GTP cyclohydrolase I FolE [Iodidimonas nitroreducens]GAK32169.1 GTP cyclohydrolase 1 [alpha proteobacterium Q-1]GER02677.1 GTP cyclohydrolase 1 [Iodidimonas nitroreducens]